MKTTRIALLLAVVCSSGCKHKDPFPGYTAIGSTNGIRILVDKPSLERPSANILTGNLVIDYQDGTHALEPFAIRCPSNELLISESSIFDEKGALVRVAKPQTLQAPEITNRLCGLMSGIAEKPLFEGAFTQVAALTSLGLSDEWNVDATNPIFKGFASGTDSKFHSEIILNERVPNIVAESRLLVVSSSPEGDNSCHACGVLLSAYLLYQKDNGWFIQSSNRYLDRGGSFGAAPVAKLIEVGPKVYGFTTEDGYTAQGVSETGTTFYGPIGDSFVNLLSVQTSSDDGGMFETASESHSSNTSFNLGPETLNGFFVIHLHSSGIDNDGNALPPERSCSFDGTKYICR